MIATLKPSVEERFRLDVLGKLSEQVQIPLDEAAGGPAGRIVPERVEPCVGKDGSGSDGNLACHATGLIGRHFKSEAMDRCLPTPIGRVNVRVSDGQATLQGRVGYDCQRIAVERVVRDIPGIRGVTNLLDVEIGFLRPVAHADQAFNR